MDEVLTTVSKCPQHPKVGLGTTTHDLLRIGDSGMIDGILILTLFILTLLRIKKLEQFYPRFSPYIAELMLSA